MEFVGMRVYRFCVFALLIGVLVGCSGSNYSETTPDKAQAAREKIKQAEGSAPGMTK